ncbi:MAG: glycosyltransferase family 4 protein [Bryobacterales bacterium]|nr:glycosyltransferase family 4 protein [Bryobacterales bacterium]
MTPLLYTLHSGNLYGTERMALATIQALGPEWDPIIFSPPGPVIAEARRLGLGAVEIHNDREFFHAIQPWFSHSRRLAVFSTRVVHSLLVCAVNLLYRRRIAHLHMVHGGADEALSYGQKRRMNHLPVTLVAVSEFVRDRLLVHGVNPKRIRVIENFLTAERVASAPRRPQFAASGLREAIVISRLDPIKRIDLLLDALETHPELKHLRVRLFGKGSDEQKLQKRAQKSQLSITFEGFSTLVDQALADSDVLIHCCDQEPFGLAILEAMAANVPVIVPDKGGAGSLIDPGRTGLRFESGDAASLAARLTQLNEATPKYLNRLTANAAEVLGTRFSQRERVADYRRVIEEALA